MIFNYLIYKKKLLIKLQIESKQIELWFLVISTIIIIPLIFSTKTLDPNLAPRLLALGVVVLIISAISNFKVRKCKHDLGLFKISIFPIFALYFVWSAFSLLQAVNPTEGLFDISLTFLSLVLLIFATYIFSRNSSFIIVLVRFVLISSLVTTLLGLYQYYLYVHSSFGYELIKSIYNIKGLMAHKNQFAISLILMLPFSLFGVLKLNKFWLGLSIVSCIMILLNIVLLQTRSVWIATLVFLLSLCILSIGTILRFGNGIVKKGVMLVVTLLTIAVVSYLILGNSGALELIEQRTTTIFNFDSSDNQGRLNVWKSTINMSKDNLFFGVGTGNWKISILPYYSSLHGIEYANWRRPHNDFLWVLAEKGVLGLLLYIVIFLLVIFYGFKVLLDKTNDDNKLLIILLISGIFGYLTIASFSFPMERVNHQIYLILMMAGIISVYIKKKNTKIHISKKLFYYTNSTVIVLAIVVIVYSGLLFKSEMYIQKSIEAKNNKDWKRLYEYSDKAFTLFTTIDANNSPIYLFKGIASTNLNRRNEAYECFKYALVHFPNHISTLNNLAIISAHMGKQPESMSYFVQMLALYPQYEIGLINMAKAQYNNNDYEKAYITLLNCNSKHSGGDYNNLLEDLKYRINNP